ncbi:MAG: uracil phosphoribosyltransferase [Legionella sp.]|nr:MAG: uracil phosphoribosyltransferase [Legionella sp.]PJD98540.1 MAG: uracil phosphoribosyltransferase [Legionella sp.]
MNKQEQNVLNSLFDLSTIRSKAKHLLELAKKDKLNYFTFHADKMDSTAAYIVEVIQQNYPDLMIPYHSRWRHFEIDGIDRIGTLLTELAAVSEEEKGRILYELVIISVFLDAGAGTQWHYQEAKSGNHYARSEGLALASLAAYQNGCFSAQSNHPYRVDASKLLALTKNELECIFQVTADNPLEGIQGRLNLLHQLGEAIQNNPVFFGADGRLGNFYPFILSLVSRQQLSAKTLFSHVLQAFNSIWPARHHFANIPLGDVWLHSALKSNEAGSEFMPFHKLSQWLTYSLMEPLERAGIEITQMDALTGLPEYRNGGLLIDTGLLTLKDKKQASLTHEPGSELIVEWRALTVALLDELALLIRNQLKQTSHSLPLAKILQGGTWQAGRRIAQQKRAQGTPPLSIISDGTVF